MPVGRTGWVCVSPPRVPCVCPCHVHGHVPGVGPPRQLHAPRLTHAWGTLPGSAVMAEPCHPLSPDAAMLAKPSWQGWGSRAGRAPHSSGVTLLPPGLCRRQGLGFWGSLPTSPCRVPAGFQPPAHPALPRASGWGQAPVLGALAPSGPPSKPSQPMCTAMFLGGGRSVPRVPAPRSALWQHRWVSVHSPGMQ